MRIDRDVYVTMSDGVRVCLTLYRPEGDGPFPAVVETLPYRKDDDCTARDWLTYAHLAEAGIAGIRIDIRGTGSSEGVIEGEYLAIEQADTIEVMEWAANQDWCTGRLGMWGISWGGFSALQTAMLRPPQLKAIAPMHATHDRFACDVHYIGGSLHGAEQADWPPSMISCNALPPDPDIFGEGWFEEWMNRLERTPQWHFEWLRHQQRDPFWLHGSPIADYSSIECPTLLIGGWLDGYVDGMLDMAANLSCPTRTVIGPWGHYRPATGVPAPTLNHFDLLARWFGHHLRGDENGIMDDLAPLTVFVHTQPSNSPDRVPGRWRREIAWPLPDSQDLSYPLGSLEPKQWDGPEWVGSHAPAWDRAGMVVAPASEDDSVSMVWESQPLEDSVEVMGVPMVSLRVRSDQAVGMVAARLLALSAEGDSILISRGNRNLAFPDEFDNPREVVPGKWIDLRFSLLACSTTLPPGWRWRLALSGADFPVVWPPGQRVTLEIDPDRSHLFLPSVPARAEDRWLDLPEVKVELTDPVIHLKDEASRTVERTDLSTTYRRSISHDQLQPTRGDLRYQSTQTWDLSVSDEDPASMRAGAISEMSLSRPGWAVSARGTLAMEGDADTLTVRVDLVAELNEAVVFERTWQEKIPRIWA